MVLTVFSLAAAFGCSVVGGVMFAFSAFVMPGLVRAPSPAGMTAMQAINVVAVRPPFMIVLFGTALLTIGFHVPERYRREWMPGLAAKYPHVDPPVGLEQLIAHLGFTPERMLHPDVDAYPAHLHIDLLPELQGRGRGRALIRRLLAELRARGVPGVHLGIDPANATAAQFYRRLGFVELPSSTADEPRFGIATDAAV